MNKKYVLILLLIIFIIIGFYKIKNEQQVMNKVSSNTTRYVPLGDSYTIGEGVNEDERWPNMLVRQLQGKGVEISLVDNPSVTGFTTQEVIKHELPAFERADPTFATLLIGANDLARGIDKNSYRENVQVILNRMQAVLPEKGNIILVTIPDFSKTPVGKQFGSEEEVVRRIQEFNTILKEEGEKRDLPVVDIFSVSQRAENDPTYIVSDGLHPSSKQYTDWVELILPKAVEVLKENE